MQFWALIVDSFRESRDRKIFWVLIAATLLVAAAMVSIGFETDRVTFLFGLSDASTDFYNPATEAGRSHIVGIVLYFLAYALLGWLGVVLMIIATAGVFPRMIERGAIDVLLSKPMSRPKLFLYKYLASMVFVLIQASLFIGLTFLVMGLRWGVWIPGYLLSIPLLVLLFSYIYCVSVLVAIKTRSAVAAILLSLGAWFVFAAPTTVLQTMDEFSFLQERTRLVRAVRVLYWVFPKTAEIPYLGAKWAKAGASIDVLPTSMIGQESPADRDVISRTRDLEQRELRKNPWLSIGSSLAFEAVIVFGAMWSFSRRDY